jgi:putative flippase GtrA
MLGGLQALRGILWPTHFGPRNSNAMRASLESFMPADLAAVPARSLLAEIAAFVLIGLGGMAGFVVLSGLVLNLATGLPDWLASSLCYGAFIVPVYLLHRRFSFGSEAPHRRALPRYVMVQGMALALATLFSVLAYGMLSMPTLVASILVVTMTSGVNFIVLRAWAFAHAH